MPLPTDPISRQQYLALAGYGESDLDLGVMRDQVIFWHGKEPQHDGTAKWAQRIYLVFDAVVAQLFEHLAKKGIGRTGLGRALPGMQMAAGKAIVAEDAEVGAGFVAIGIAHSGKALAVLGGTKEQMFADGGLPVSLYGWACHCQIGPAMRAVRKAARKHRIELPGSLAMPPDAKPFWAQGNPRWSHGAFLWEAGRTDQPMKTRAPSSLPRHLS